MADKNKEFFFGVRSALPIALGYLPLGFAFGVLAAEVGLSLTEVFFMSLMVFAGSGQFVTIALLGAQASFSEIILTNFLINARHFLMGAALAPHLSRFHKWLLPFIAWEITDETFVVAINHYQEHPATEAYHLGLNLTSHLSWITFTVLGAVAGGYIPNPERLGLNFALPAMFIALLLLQLKDNIQLVVALFAGTLSLLIYYFLPGNLNIIIASILAAALGVIIETCASKS